MQPHHLIHFQSKASMDSLVDNAKNQEGSGELGSSSGQSLQTAGCTRECTRRKKMCLSTNRVFKYSDRRFQQNDYKQSKVQNLEFKTR